MSLKRTADQAYIRKINLSLVLRHIHDEAPVSRAKIAKVTGLNKSTVSSLVDDLLKRGLIRENGRNSTGTGRPATLLEINPGAGGIIGVQFGVDFVAVVLTDFIGEIQWRRTIETDPNEAQTGIIAQTLTLVDEAIDACNDQQRKLFGIGLSVPGIVDIERGVLIFAPNLQWWNVPLRKTFAEHTGLKVYVENDANAAATAEHLFGVARKIKDFIFVFAGVGIGGGLFLNGNLYRGKKGYAGEIGHSPIITNLPLTTCRCGNLGCWETLANQASILQRVQTNLDEKRSKIIPELLTEHDAPLSISIIKQAAEANDECAILSIAEAGAAMGQGFAGLVNIFNPDKIILGGPISSVGEYMLSSIEKSMTRYSLNEFGSLVTIVVSSFGPDASLIGGIAIVVGDILSNPMQVERR